MLSARRASLVISFHVTLRQPIREQRIRSAAHSSRPSRVVVMRWDAAGCVRQCTARQWQMTVGLRCGELCWIENCLSNIFLGKKLLKWEIWTAGRPACVTAARMAVTGSRMTSGCDSSCSSRQCMLQLVGTAETAALLNLASPLSLSLSVPSLRLCVCRVNSDHYIRRTGGYVSRYSVCLSIG